MSVPKPKVCPDAAQLGDIGECCLSLLSAFAVCVQCVVLTTSVSASKVSVVGHGSKPATFARRARTIGIIRWFHLCTTERSAQYRAVGIPTARFYRCVGGVTVDRPLADCFAVYPCALFCHSIRNFL